MRLTTEREAAMPLVGRAVIGLRLAAQYRFHDLRQPVVARKAVDQSVEDRGRDDLPQREALVERVEIILQADELFAARRLMDAVHDRRLLRFERLRCRDVGRAHIIDRKSTRRTPVTNAHLVCRLLLESKSITKEATY